MSKQYSNLGFNSDYQSKHVTLDDITFNNVKHVDTGHTQRLGRGTWSTLETSGTLTDNSFSVNAVDIDWNNAQWPSSGSPATPTTINTTGDLINAIKWASLQGSSFVLNQATSSSLGGIKVGYTQNGKNYPVQLSNGDAYVNVPWINSTEITTTISDALKQATIRDSSSDKFKIQFTTVDDIAYIKVSDNQSNEISTALPGVKIDGDNRKMVWTNAAGSESNEAIQFGNFDIIAVFESMLPVSPGSGGHYVPMEFEEDISENVAGGEVIVDYPIFVGDLVLALNSEEEMHLWVCKESDYDDEEKTGTTAYFIDLGPFPGNNITLDASNIQVSGIDSDATGGNNISNVQEALDYLLYYTTVNPSDVAELED